MVSTEPRIERERSAIAYVIDGHRVELVRSPDGDRWVCDCIAYQARVASAGPPCTHAWDAYLFTFTERLLRAGGVCAPEAVQ